MNPGTPEKTPTISPPSPSFPLSSDIPVALRDTPNVLPKPGISKTVLIAGLSGVGMVALLLGGLVSLQLRQSQDTTLATANPTPTTQPDPSPTQAARANDTLLGHLPYPEAPRADLEPINGGGILMRRSAARAFQSMVAAAEQAGVYLTPISGFRSRTDQDYLFFDVKAERGQVAQERAKVSAPPGYSEHHTGYAVDIGDANTPATNLSQSFERTEAFRWLQANAAHYSFELSFPKNNAQGVMYEPWHWRFVGDRQSLETFYKARVRK